MFVLFLLQLVRCYTALHGCGLLSACTSGTLESLACELIRAVARLPPSATPTAIQLAAGVLDLALSMASGVIAVDSVLDYLLDESEIRIPSSLHSSGAATLGSSATIRASPARSKAAVAAAAPTTSDSVGTLFYSRFKDSVVRFLLRADVWRQACTRLFTAMNTHDTVSHNHPWLVLATIMDAVKPTVSGISVAKPVDPAAVAKVKPDDVTDIVLQSLPLIDRWIAVDAPETRLLSLAGLLDRIGSLSYGAYYTSSKMSGERLRFVDTALRRLFADTAPVTVKVRWLAVVWTVVY